MIYTGCMVQANITFGQFFMLKPHHVLEYSIAYTEVLSFSFTLVLFNLHSRSDHMLIC